MAVQYTRQFYPSTQNSDPTSMRLLMLFYSVSILQPLFVPSDMHLQIIIYQKPLYIIPLAPFLLLISFPQAHLLSLHYQLSNTSCLFLLDVQHRTEKMFVTDISGLSSALKQGHHWPYHVNRISKTSECTAYDTSRLKIPAWCSVSNTCSVSAKIDTCTNVQSSNFVFCEEVLRCPRNCTYAGDWTVRDIRRGRRTFAGYVALF